MNGALFLIGLPVVIIGLILTITETGGRVRASTEFGDFSGAVGPVALILGITMMGLSVIF